VGVKPPPEYRHLTKNKYLKVTDKFRGKGEIVFLQKDGSYLTWADLQKKNAHEMTQSGGERDRSRSRKGY
jgi:hypothetical protein